MNGSYVRTDYQDTTFQTTFNAQEIIEELMLVLKKNITSEELKSQIVKTIKKELQKIAWFEKYVHINQTIKQIHENTGDNSSKNEECKKLFEELADTIAFLQLLGGIETDSEAPKLQKDFHQAFTFLFELFKRIQWPENQRNYPPPLLNIRKKFHTLIFGSMAEIINLNYNHMPTFEHFHFCLNTLLDIDGNDSFHSLLLPEIAKYYEKLQIQHYRTRIMPNQLEAALKVMIRTNIDFSESIRNLPNDRMKYYHLQRKMDSHPKIMEELKFCIYNTNQIEVLVLAYQNFPNDTQILEKLMIKLSEIINFWLVTLMSQRPLADTELRNAFRQYQNAMNHIPAGLKSQIFQTIVESDFGPSLKNLLATDQRMKGDDQMIQEIKNILSS